MRRSHMVLVGGAAAWGGCCFGAVLHGPRVQFRSIVAADSDWGASVGAAVHGWIARRRKLGKACFKRVPIARFAPAAATLIFVVFLARSPQTSPGGGDVFAGDLTTRRPTDSGSTPEVSRNQLRGGSANGGRGLVVSITGEVLRGDRATPAVGRAIALEFFDHAGQLLKTVVTTNGLYTAQISAEPGETGVSGRVSLTGQDLRPELAEQPFVVDSEDSQGPDFVVYYDLIVEVEPYLGDCTCNDLDPCSFDRCIENDECTFEPRPYGDTDGNGLINVFDLFCVMDGFGGKFFACSPSQVDLHGACTAPAAPCCPNGIINIFDLFAVLDVFNGLDACCGG